MNTTKKITHRLDTRALWELLDDVREVRGLSWRAVARQTGGMYSHVFARMRTGREISLNAAVSLLAWADHYSLEGLIVPVDKEGEGHDA